MSDCKTQDRIADKEERTTKKHWKGDVTKEKISKKLCYVLRFGAIKEGLRVYEGDYVDFKELMALPMMKRHREQDVLSVVEESKSWKGFKRFMVKKEYDRTMVRALSVRNFEKSPYHLGTKVPTLLETCQQFVVTNLQDFDLEDFPDEFLISSMIHRLRRCKKLNNTSLKVLLVPVLERLSLEGVFVSEATLRLIYAQCPNLRQLSLKDCGYIVTNTVVQRLLKKLPRLESLTLSGCSHLTDTCLEYLTQDGQKLQHLNLSKIHTFSEDAVLRMLESLPHLRKVDIFEVNMSVEARSKLNELKKDRGLVVYLKRLPRTDMPTEQEAGPNEEQEEHLLESYAL